MSDTITALQFREKQLSLFCSKEISIAVLAAVSTISFSPFPIIFFPFLVVFWNLFSRKPTAEERDTISRHIEIPRNVIIRMTKNEACKLYSVPFISILFIPEDKLPFLQFSWSAGELHHELGHHRQTDMAAILWLGFAALAWIALFFWNLPAGLSTFDKMRSGEYDPDVIGSIPLIATNGGFYLNMLMLLVAAVVFASLQRIFHNREYLADLRGYQYNKGSTLAFLESELQMENEPGKPENNLVSVRDKITHPSFLNRVNAFKTEDPNSNISDFGAALVWSFSIASIVAAFFVLVGDKLANASSNGILTPLFFLMVGLVICLTGFFADRIFFTCGNKNRLQALGSLSIGYVIGFSMALSHYFIFLYLIGVRLSQETEIGFETIILLLFVGVTLWIGMNAMTNLLFHLLGRPNHFRYGYALLNFGGAVLLSGLLFTPLMPEFRLNMMDQFMMFAGIFFLGPLILTFIISEMLSVIMFASSCGVLALNSIFNQR